MRASGHDRSSVYSELLVPICWLHACSTDRTGGCRNGRTSEGRGPSRSASSRSCRRWTGLQVSRCIRLRPNRYRQRCGAFGSGRGKQRKRLDRVNERPQCMSRKIP
ncbi:hypothetical protein GLE_4590 [Lysobacter enzymogenes]|uniref:Uncharacterized protein n=1 Tax=Lysobacter enzymogenes TaxID=69 RepID=A0A0S2DMG0_LYSEN|nr:hypothetical protein GLE_4590 [Lysobacter enzymogenes]